MMLKLSLASLFALTLCLASQEFSQPGRAASPAEMTAVYGGAPQCADWKSTYLTYCSYVCGYVIAFDFTLDAGQITSVDTLMCDSVETCTALMPGVDVCSTY